MSVDLPTWVTQQHPCFNHFYICACLLSKSYLSNQHIEIVQMFLDSEFLIINSTCLHISHIYLLCHFCTFSKWIHRMEFLKCFLTFSMTWNTALLILWKNIELSTHMFNNMFTQPTTNAAQQLIKKMCEDTATFLEQ